MKTTSSPIAKSNPIPNSRHVSKSKTNFSFAPFLLAALAALLVFPSCQEKFNQTSMPAKGEEIAVLTTNKGVIKMKFFADKAPESVKNFKTLATEGKYDGVIFHRVIPGFMIQGGDFTKKDGTGGYSYKGPGTTIALEVSPDLTHVHGAVSMARKGNDVNSNGSQFFIVTPKDGAHFLDNQYSVFGQVFEGFDAVDAISAVKTGPGDKPLEDVVVQKVEILEQE